MQECPQRQSLSLYHPVIVTREKRPVGIDMFQQKVTVKNKRIGLVPGLIHPGPPINSTIVILGQVPVISPYRLVCSYDIGSSHDFHHFH